MGHSNSTHAVINEAGDIVRVRYGHSALDFKTHRDRHISAVEKPVNSPERQKYEQDSRFSTAIVNTATKNPDFYDIEAGNKALPGQSPRRSSDEHRKSSSAPPRRPTLFNRIFRKSEAKPAIVSPAIEIPTEPNPMPDPPKPALVPVPVSDWSPPPSTASPIVLTSEPEPEPLPLDGGQIAFTKTEAPAPAPDTTADEAQIMKIIPLRSSDGPGPSPTVPKPVADGHGDGNHKVVKSSKRKPKPSPPVISKPTRAHTRYPPSEPSNFRHAAPINLNVHPSKVATLLPFHSTAKVTNPHRTHIRPPHVQVQHPLQRPRSPKPQTKSDIQSHYAAHLEHRGTFSDNEYAHHQLPVQAAAAAHPRLTQVSVQVEDDGQSDIQDEDNQSSVIHSRKKLIVRGLKKFTESHRQSYPPLWVKEFPCRSRYHVDNYIHESEGGSFPSQRNLDAMAACSKKGGRCDRCGIYCGDICQSCRRCEVDCQCDSNQEKLRHSYNQMNGGCGGSGDDPSQLVGQFGGVFTQASKLLSSLQKEQLEQLPTQYPFSAQTNRHPFSGQYPLPPPPPPPQHPSSMPMPMPMSMYPQYPSPYQPAQYAYPNPYMMPPPPMNFNYAPYPVNYAPYQHPQQIPRPGPAFNGYYPAGPGSPMAMPRSAPVPGPAPIPTPTATPMYRQYTTANGMSNNNY